MPGGLWLPDCRSTACCGCCADEPLAPRMPPGGCEALLRRQAGGGAGDACREGKLFSCGAMAGA